MRWLIVEDALCDKKGHWYEYIATFEEGLRALGDQVTILADHHAEPFILETLDAKPVLPDSIWRRMGDGAGFLKRYLRVPIHAWQTWRAIRRYLKRERNWDIIFVPTVMVHHLLGWYWLVRFSLRRSSARVLLFFPNLPIRLGAEGSPVWSGSPTTRLMRLLFDKLKPDILSGRVLLGVETYEMREAFTTLLKLPVMYFPHPVRPLADFVATDDDPTPVSDELLMACYGPGRPEKGSDVLQEALVRYLSQSPKTAALFAFQWTQDFKNDRGEMVGVLPFLQSHPRVDVIRRYFDEGEYPRHLLATKVMLLPYRRSSYGLRVSRVIIEALVNGIPVVATNETTLAAQALEFGAVVGCEDGLADSLCAGIETAEKSYTDLRARAVEKMAKAREHFSVMRFRELLLKKTNGG